MPNKDSLVAYLKKQNLTSFEIISPDSKELTRAREYLSSLNEYAMAEYLEYLAKQGLIRAGPLEGFLATTCQDPASNEEYLLLSNYYPEYNMPIQITASLIHEIGAAYRFNFTHEENTVRENGVYFYLGEHKEFNIEVEYEITNLQKRRINSILLTSYKNMEFTANILRRKGIKTTVWMLFSVYNEINRIKQKSIDNPNGEDAIRVKIKQLEALFGAYKDILDWKLVMVDNRSLDKTGYATREILLQDEQYRSFIKDGHFQIITVSDNAPP